MKTNREHCNICFKWKRVFTSKLFFYDSSGLRLGKMEDQIL